MAKHELSDNERVERLEVVLGTLILWLKGTISTAESQRLLDALTAADAIKDLEESFAKASGPVA